MNFFTLSCTNVWRVISVGHLQEAALLGQLLDRIAAVAQDAPVSVDVGDRAAAACGVEERRVVRHEAEVVFVHLDLAQVGGVDRAVLDRKLIGPAGPAIGD
jgi:hypothetical protein